MFLVFLLVLARLMGLVQLAPVFSHAAVPMRLRAALAVALALLVTPSQLAAGVTVPHELPRLALALGAEALVGASLGLTLAVLLAAAKMAGQLVGQLSGFSLAEQVDPELGPGSGVSRMFYILGVAAFLLVGGHRLMMEGLLESFATLPAGQASWNTDWATVLTSQIADSLALAVRIAAPAAIAVVTSIVAVGLLARSVPQLNLFAVSFSLQSAVMLGAMVVSLAGLTWVFVGQVAPNIEHWLRTVIAA